MSNAPSSTKHIALSYLPGFVLVISTFIAGCAHSSPALAPARLLRSGRVTMDIGGSYTAPVAEPYLSNAIAANTRVQADPATVTAEDRAAITQAVQLFAPTANGTSEYLAVRVGVPQRTELGFALLGLRSLRVGVRHAFWQDASENWSWTLGANARGGYDLSSYGVAVGGAMLREGMLAGGEITTQLGRTSSDLYDVWIGARAGYTYGAATVSHPAFNATSMGILQGRLHRAELGATLGLRVGFGRIAAVAELEVLTTLFWGSAENNAVRAQGVMLSLIPAGAIAFSF